MAPVAMLFVGPIIAFGIVFFIKVRSAFKASDEAEGTMTARLQENLTGIRVVRAFARQDHERASFAAANASFRDLDWYLIRLLAVYWPISDLMCICQTGLVLFFGAYWALQGKISIGDWVAFLALVNMFLWPVRRIGRTLTELGKVQVSLGRVREILCQSREDAADAREVPAACSKQPEQHRGEIVFDKVSFSHGQTTVLNGLSFRVEPGRTLAILGPSGSGKSTLVNLLLRLYEGYEGTITLDGRDIRDFDRKALRSQIGAVLQDPFLYSRSLRDNIRLGNGGADDAAITAASTAACVHESIQSFEHGYDTVIGERGVTLSGGQRQRVALARAIVRDPLILILDDALSSVDTHTEAMILRALRSRHGRRTTLVIAHRLSTLRHADWAIVLDGGGVVQAGTHEGLMAADGLYRRLWTIQNSLEADLREDLQPTSS